MKTIDVILETADEYLEYAVINHNDEKRALFAAIAQAAATVAQAMILHEVTTKDELPAVRIIGDVYQN